MTEDTPSPSRPSSDRDERNDASVSGDDAGPRRPAGAEDTSSRPAGAEDASSRPPGAADAGTPPTGTPSQPGTRPRWEEPRPSRDRWDEPSAGTAGGAPGADGARPHDARADYARREHLQRNITSRSTWLRFVFIVLFAALLSLAEIVLMVVIAVQFVWVLINGEPNPRLKSAGRSLARYAYQVIRYLTFSDDARPFPVDLDWPSDRPDSSAL